LNIARESHHVAYPVVLAPLQQLFSAEARIGPHDDFGLRPRRPDLLHNAFHLLRASCRGVLIRRPQPRTQQVLARKDIERQVAVFIVVAVKEAAFLMTV
jgi:hypothetical protein